MNVELSEDSYRILQQSVDCGRFSTIEEALDGSVHLLADEPKPTEDWLAYADERISAGLADLAAGRVVPAEQVLAEMRERNRR